MFVGFGFLCVSVHKNKVYLLKIKINEIIQKCQKQKSNVITVASILAHTHFFFNFYNAQVRYIFKDFGCFLPKTNKHREYYLEK